MTIKLSGRYRERDKKNNLGNPDKKDNTGAMLEWGWYEGRCAGSVEGSEGLSDTKDSEYFDSQVELPRRQRGHKPGNTRENQPFARVCVLLFSPVLLFPFLSLAGGLKVETNDSLHPWKYRLLFLPSREIIYSTLHLG